MSWHVPSSFGNELSAVGIAEAAIAVAIVDDMTRPALGTPPLVVRSRHDV